VLREIHFPHAFAIAHLVRRMQNFLARLAANRSLNPRHAAARKFPGAA
jgi:hypothetical protein